MKHRLTHLMLLLAVLLGLGAYGMASATPRSITEKEWRMQIGLPDGMPIPAGMPHPTFAENKASLLAAPDQSKNVMLAAAANVPGGGNRDCNSNLIFADSDGLNQHIMTSAPNMGNGFYSPRWSPDGAILVYSQNTGYLLLRSSDGLTRTLTTGYSPAWAPDGQTIFFSRLVGSANQIFSIRVDGSDEKQLTSTNLSKWSPSVSQDGSRVAFVQQDTQYGTNDLVTMNVDGTGLVRWTQQMYIGWPTWTADGQIVAGVAMMGTTTSNRIYKFKSGVEYVPISEGPADYQPNVQLDGSILFSSNANGMRMSVWRMNADGSNRTRLAFGEGADQSVDGQLAFTDYTCAEQNDWACGALFWHYGIAEVTGEGTQQDFQIKTLVKKPEMARAISVTSDLETNLSLQGWQPRVSGQTGPGWQNPSAGMYTATYRITNPDVTSVMPTVWLADSDGSSDSVNFWCGRLTHYVGGKVRSFSGLPAGGVKIEIQGRDYSNVTWTDSNGDYKVRWLVDGDYTILASRPGYEFPNTQRFLVNGYSGAGDMTLNINATGGWTGEQHWVEFAKTEVTAPVNANAMPVSVVYTGTNELIYDLRAFMQGSSEPYSIKRVTMQPGTTEVSIPLPPEVYAAGTFVAADIVLVNNYDVNVGPTNTRLRVNLATTAPKVQFSSPHFNASLNSSTITASLTLDKAAYAPVEITVEAQEEDTLIGSTDVVFNPGETFKEFSIDLGDNKAPTVVLRLVTSDPTVEIGRIDMAVVHRATVNPPGTCDCRLYLPTVAH